MIPLRPRAPRTFNLTPPARRSGRRPIATTVARRSSIPSQIAVDDHSGVIVDIAPSVPGPSHDLTVLKESGLLTRLPVGVGALGDLAYAASPSGCRLAWARRHAASRALNRVRRKTCAKWTVIIGASTPPVWSRWRAWSIARCAAACRLADFHRLGTEATMLSHLS